MSVRRKYGQRQGVHGSLPIPFLERFWGHLTVLGNGCWQWNGARSGKLKKYAQVSLDGRRVYVHRAAYEALRRPVPRGLMIDHLCRNTVCVNPDHMEPVTNRENVVRGIAARSAL